MTKEMVSCKFFEKFLTPFTTVLFLAILIICSTACGDSKEQSRYKSVGPDGWAYSDTITFITKECLAASDHPLSYSDSAQHVCDVALTIRHTNGYEYSNVWLELTYSPEMDSIVRDTINMRLADPLGHWQGKGIGVAYQKVDTVLHDAPINLASPMLVRHIMRADTLKDIEQIGIIITTKK